MTEQLVLNTQFGRIAVEIDPSAFGKTASGRRTEGAVTAVRIGQQVTKRELSSARLSDFSRQVQTAINAWLDGDGNALDGIGVRYQGTEFQQRVLIAMRRIKAGQTDSYAGLAARAGVGSASRAVGSVCARNRIPIIVPCHRVTRSGGDLGNYGFGVEMKLQLLQLEGAR